MTRSDEAGREALEQRLSTALRERAPEVSETLRRRVAAVPEMYPRPARRASASVDSGPLRSTTGWLDDLLEPLRLAWALGAASVTAAAVAGFLLGTDLDSTYESAGELTGLVYGPSDAPEDWQ